MRSFVVLSSSLLPALSLLLVTPLVGSADTFGSTLFGPPILLAIESEYSHSFFTPEGFFERTHLRWFDGKASESIILPNGAVATGPGGIDGNGEMGLLHQIGGVASALPKGGSAAAEGLYGAITSSSSLSLGSGISSSFPMSASSALVTDSKVLPSLLWVNSVPENTPIVNPEPGTLLLLGTGLLGVFVWRFRRRTQP